ncbi:hypothetical protein Rsub_03087 [Raphidocelis subcapitata]|uniref:CTLH domain-containing protein n=1 Tax=Raphidocelis subcapitata TaxID=307507 RepID=A0A2V0NT29_9CHLO|nr:hypothetical protein Rsub_03087 [Raphidocelis subcapitata]|eukprot:GBF90786.1 hypothetical protein Rsub_03087 [Raphidocelis subcapitata]
MRSNAALATLAALLALAATARADPSAAACHNSTSKAECLRKDACVFCLASLVPSGCFLDSEAKLLPGFMYNCSDDAAEEAAAAALGKGGKKPDPGPGPIPGPGCATIKDKKDCKHSPDKCVWCTGMFGQDSCYSEDQAKFLPSAFFKCSKPPSEMAAALQELMQDGLADLEGKKKKDDDDKKEDCKDIKERKACRKSKSVCSWCENKFAPGAPMCADEAQAKFYPPMVFDCEASKRASDGSLQITGGELVADLVDLLLGGGEENKKGGDDKKEDCKDIKERKACRKSDSVCSWCENKYAPGAPMCADEATAKFLPPMVFECKASKRTPEGALLEGDDEEDEEPAVMMMDLALSADENKRDKKKGGDDKKEDCRDIKERKACRKSDSVCSWCENKYAPGAPMCADEATAKFLPPMVFECEASKRAPEGALLEEDDEFEALALPLESGEDGKGGGGFGPKANCRDLKERKACRKSEAVCSWCEGKFGGAPMCVDEDQAQYLPAMAFDCEPSKRPSANDFDTADEENKKGGHDKKEDCRDLKERKACRKSDSVCSWCVGKYGGQAMCADEAQAKYLPPMAFDCEPSKHAPDSALLEDDEDDEDDDDLEGRRHKRHSDDDKTEDCKDIKDRHACRKSKSVCNWCQGAFMPGAAMCMGEWEQRLAQVALSKSDLNRLVMDFLVTEGYVDAARAFQDESGTQPGVDLSDIAGRMEIRAAVQGGRVEDAIDAVNDLDPEILEERAGLLFHLQQQRLIELVRAGRTADALEFAREYLAPAGEEHPEFLEDLERTVALLAFEDPRASPLGELMEASQRQRTASELNAAILSSQRHATEPRAAMLLKMMVWAQQRLDERATYPKITDLAAAVPGGGGGGGKD